MAGRNPRRRLDLRLLLLLAASLLALAATLAPRVSQGRAAYRLLAVVDVTGSMNVRDYERGSANVSRLKMAKAALRDLAAGLPCGSGLGLGIFTERRSFLLFEPVEVCANFAPIDGAIADLDWHMAWEGDSHVASGLFSAIALARPVEADVVFLTDGHEAPPLPASGMPPFEGEKGVVRGLIIGVGGTTPAQIPKFDWDGREIGFYRMEDVPQENRHGLPPADATGREGWHPRNAPWGGEAAVGEEHLSAVRTEHLEALAATTGLAYAPLLGAGPLLAHVEAAARPRTVTGLRDTAPWPAGFALLALAGLYAGQLVRTRFRPISIRKG